MNVFGPDPSNFKTINFYAFLKFTDFENNVPRNFNGYERSDGLRHKKTRLEVMGYG